MVRRKNQRKKLEQQPTKTRSKRLGENVIVDVNDMDVDTKKEPDKVMVEVETGINRLPDEVLLHTFNFLSHGDKLWTRVVCKRWNKILIDYGQFLRNSIIRIVPIDYDCRHILANSSVNWVNLHLRDLRSEEPRRVAFVIPRYMQATVRTLKISNSQLTWKGFKEILVQFPRLEKLKLRRLGITDAHGNMIPAEKATNLTSEFRAVLTGINSLTVSKCSIRILRILFHKFKLCLTSIITLAIKKFNCDVDFLLTRKDSEELSTGLFELIENSCRTLKHLVITNIQNGVGMDMENLIFQNAFQKLISSPIATASLKLESLELHPSLIQVNVLLEFLKMNSTLKKIRCLPPSLPPRDDNHEDPVVVMKKLWATIPTIVEHLFIPSRKYIAALDGHIFDQFPNLHEIELGERTHPFRTKLLGLQFQTRANVRKIHQVKLESSDDVRRLVANFSNITHLSITFFTFTPPLHRLARDMQFLKTLKLCVIGSVLTDSMLTGIRASYCFVLGGFHKNTLKTKIIPQSQRVGPPLSSLRRLEELQIFTHKMQITDVGICFGFQFTNLKRLSITNTGEMTQVTLAGLNYIADFNPSLEKLYLDRVFCVESVPGWSHQQYEGLAEFKERLTRCKQFRIKVLTFPGHVKEEVIDLPYLSPPSSVSSFSDSSSLLSFSDSEEDSTSSGIDISEDDEF